MDATDSATKDRNKQLRINTSLKRRLCTTIWNRILLEYGRERLEAFGLPNADTLWKLHVARRFRDFTPGDATSERQMETHIRAIVHRAEHNNRALAPPSPPVRAPLPPVAPAPQAQAPPHVVVRMVPVPGERIIRAVANIVEARDGFITRRQPPPILAQVQGQGEGIPGDIPVEVIERMFLTHGLGESGRICQVCLEPKSKWCRFSATCDHDMCYGCAKEWVAANLMPIDGGIKCPGCLHDGAAAAASSSSTTSAAPMNGPAIVDPAILFKNVDDINPRFSAIQIIPLQKSLDIYCMNTMALAVFDDEKAFATVIKPKDLDLVSKCPNCLTVNVTKYTLVRCHNPKCALEYCSTCESTLGYTDKPSMDAIRKRHLNKLCSGSLAETRDLIGQGGISICTKCNTPLWHAKRHGCHHVICPKCGHEQCHSCDRTYRDPECKCPIFCRNDFKCKCADSCPECKVSKCAHCDGACTECLNRIKK